MTSQIKHLYVNGDSFSFGQELGGPLEDRANFYTFTEHMRRFSYTGIIRDNFGIQGYTNNSSPGGSNDRIFRTTVFDVLQLLETCQPSEIFVILSVTHSSRREFRESEAAANTYFPYMNSVPEHNSKIRKRMWDIYTTYFDGVHENVDRFLLQIISLQSFFKTHGIPYLITNSMCHSTDFMEILNEQPRHVLQTIDRRRYPDIAFGPWAWDNKHPFGSNHHPLEEGHLAWANFLINYIEGNELFTPDSK